MELTVGDGVADVGGTANAVIALGGRSCIATANAFGTFVDGTTHPVRTGGIVRQILAV